MINNKSCILDKTICDNYQIKAHDNRLFCCFSYKSILLKFGRKKTIICIKSYLFFIFQRSNFFFAVLSQRRADGGVNGQGHQGEEHPHQLGSTHQEEEEQFHAVIAATGRYHFFILVTFLFLRILLTFLLLLLLLLLLNLLQYFFLLLLLNLLQYFFLLLRLLLLQYFFLLLRLLLLQFFFLLLRLLLLPFIDYSSSSSVSNV